MSDVSGADDVRFSCDARFPTARVLRLAERAIAASRLDLSGLRVLTEAAVGYARMTPVLAALAGAEDVFAVGRDSLTASRRDAEAQTAWLAKAAGVAGKVTVFSTRLQAPLAAVDIITDLPGVRPIDESIVRNLTDGAAVTLMRGADWWRMADVDVATCRRSGLPVAGVDEEAAGLPAWTALVAVRAFLEMGVEVAGATILVAGEGRGYPHVVRALAQLGARVLVGAPENAGRIALYGGEKAGDGLADEALRGRLTEAEGLVLCPAPGRRVVGHAGDIEARELAQLAPHLAVIPLGDELDGGALAAAGLACWPAAGPNVAVELLPRAIVDLHVAGLRVGEVMARARRQGSSPPAAEELAASLAGAELLPKDLPARPAGPRPGGRP